MTQQNSQHSSGDTSVIELLEYFKRGIVSFFELFRRFFRLIYCLFISVIILIYKNYILTLIILALIVVKTIYSNSFANQEIYQAQMIIQPNFDSVYALYQNIEYYNSLIENQDYKSLSEELGLSLEQTQSIRKIDIEPIKKEKDIYDKYIKRYVKADKYKLTYFSYDKYLKNIKPQDYKLYILSVKATLKDMFQPLEHQVIQKISQTDIFQERRQSAIENFKRNDSLNRQSLHNISDIVDVYLEVNHSLAKDPTRQQPQALTNIIGTSMDTNTAMEGMEFLSHRTKISEMEAKNKLDFIDQSEVVKVISHFPKYGFLERSLPEKALCYNILLGILVSIVIVLLKEVFLRIRLDVLSKTTTNHQGSS